MILLGILVCGAIAGTSGILLRSKYLGHKREDIIVDWSMFGISAVTFIAWCLLFS